MLSERVVAAERAGRSSRSRPRRGPPRWRKLGELLAEAQRPILDRRRQPLVAAAREAMQRFAERFALPVATSYRRLPLFDPLHPCYAGDLGIGPNPKLVARIKDADLVLLVGGRLGELASQGYTLFDIPGPQTKLVHVHPGAEELGRVSTGRIWRSMRARRRSPQPLERLQPPDSHRLARADEAGARRLSCVDRAADRAARRRQSRRGHGVAARKPAGRHDPVQRRRQLRRLDPSLLSLPPIRHTHRADIGIDGLRHAGGRRDEAPLSRAHR